jgi:hypothetical protein
MIESNYRCSNCEKATSPTGEGWLEAITSENGITVCAVKYGPTQTPEDSEWHHFCSFKCYSAWAEETLQPVLAALVESRNP